MAWFRRKADSASGTTDTRARPHDQPIEVGAVEWGRSLDEALDRSRQSNKPVFALFQEVPGCAGCKQFGADVLSDPLVVDAVHEAFVPLLIHNNTPGPDAEILARYGEPAWNFQVVRFLGPDGNDVIERRDRVWETGPLAGRMLDALAASGAEAPLFLQLLEQERSDRLETVDVVQDCFWVGETMIGRLDGVVTTRAGFVDRLEVTRVEFDPTRTTLRAVVDGALASSVATAVFVDDEGAAGLSGSPVPVRAPSAFSAAPPSDQKRQLGGRFDRSDLSLAQLTKLNGFVPTRSGRGEDFLSLRQREQLNSAP